MALTDTEETKVRDIINAFDNGKKLADLPEVSGYDNPFDFWCEVLNADGESCKAQLAKMLPYLEAQCAYGVEIDPSSSATTLTRVGNSDLHKSLPVQSRMKGCLLADDGTVNKYLNFTSWLDEDRSGALGQVMVEIPGHYARFSVNTDTGVKTVMVSEVPLPGYIYIPKMYVSAYEAAVDRTNLLLCSIVNTDAQYRGGGNNSAFDGTNHSLLGRPATSISRTNFRTYARKRNSQATNEWNCYTYLAHRTLYWLYVIEYANLNCQADYNAELTSEGYHQGGLGAGVTTWNSTVWSTHFEGSGSNNYYPTVPCGYTDELGNGTGVKDMAVLDDDGNELITFAVPRYRGVENPFGHIWKWAEGMNIRISPDEADGGDGTSRVYIQDDPSGFSDSSYDGYTEQGLIPRKEGYVKEIYFGDKGDIMPTEVGGGSTSYYSDYFYTSIPTSETLQGVLFGGHASHGAQAGLAYAYTYYAPSNTSTSIGSRLCFHPSEA